jgi:hypothetical protein
MSLESIIMLGTINSLQSKPSLWSDRPIGRKQRNNGNKLDHGLFMNTF